MGCSSKPMICLDKRFKPAGPICCGWICVDVTRDVNHCGHCFHRCKYSRSCCQGRCKNLDRDVHNCGFCGRRCPKRTKCVFGMCGYGG
ncbi:hypothetical protein SELMODRAFT_76417 [Selaginella moellendorffii]|uniref:Stigma-specific STIG1-like protein 1 n=1 Tax=Selaginella moellendorffii TaxID=88036 RepID=D8QU01_SELML|nr:hypothetical protein SELMODRAFT_94795 [Selaginella moellendorffii]EFJ36734.1 hypothetical protein SELMODRAFT_76417 [Selaginella moellendorffii]